MHISGTRKKLSNMLKILSITLTFLLTCGTIVNAEPASTLISAISQINANVVFMRHALATGFGDPANFQLNDCKTQRNLDEKGKQQAKLIGRELLNSSIEFSEILSSEWCRCKETVSLLNIGKWKTFSGLNSFFQNYVGKEETLTNLRRKLSNLNEGVTLMVTHQVVISAITGSTSRSGELIAFNTKTKASINVILN